MMVFEIQAQPLLDCLDRLHNISQTKNVKPILANTLIEAQEDRLRFSTNDLEICLTVEKEAEIQQTGRVTLPTQELFRLAGRMRKDAPIRFEENENFWVTITSGRSRYRLSGLDPDEFPEPPQLETGQALMIANEAFSGMIDRSIFSISTDINKKTLNGVLCQGIKTEEGAVIRTVATDGHRLALVDQQHPQAEMLPAEGVILPGKGLREIRRIAGSGEGEISLALGETHAWIAQDENRMFLRLFEGRFPDYDRVIPAECTRRMVLDREELVEALNRVSIFASDKYVGVKMELEENQVLLSFNNPGVGEAHETLEATYEGEAMAISFNARYLIDVMNVLEAPTATIQLNDVSMPCLIEEEKENRRCRYVIMPMMP